LREEDRIGVPNEFFLSQGDMNTIFRSPSFNMMDEMDLNYPNPSTPIILDFPSIPELELK